MYDVVALGELLIDFTPAGRDAAGDPLFARKPGGAPANVLAALVKLGGSAAFMGKVGNDAFGRYLAATLNGLDINTSGLVFDPDVSTTLAFVHLDEGGDRSFSFYRNPGADTMLRPEEINHSLIQNCRILHTGSLSLTDEPARTATLEAIKAAKKLGKVVSFDPNYRAMLWKSPDDARRQMMQGLALANIVKVSEEESELLLGHADPERCSQHLREMGATLVLVSLGNKGAFYRVGDLFGHVPTYQVKTVDTNGAGDAFLGAVLYRLREMSLARIGALSAGELGDIVRFANAAGSVATTRSGSIPAMPDHSQIRACQTMAPLLNQEETR